MRRECGAKRSRVVCKGVELCAWWSGLHSCSHRVFMDGVVFLVPLVNRWEAGD